MSTGIGGIVCAAAVAALVAAPAGGGTEALSRIVDGTVECKLPPGGGYPDPAPVYVNVNAIPRLGDWPPIVNVYDDPSGNVGWSAGFQTSRTPQHPRGGVWINRSECGRSRRRVPLTTAGLRGGLTSLGARHRCEVPARVLVRVRVEFTRPVALRPVGEQFAARGTIVRGTVAVRILRGAPLFLGSAEHRGGTARSFVAPGRCERA